jgi:hypothetical protein
MDAGACPLLRASPQAAKHSGNALEMSGAKFELCQRRHRITRRVVAQTSARALNRLAGFARLNERLSDAKNRRAGMTSRSACRARGCLAQRRLTPYCSYFNREYSLWLVDNDPQ